MINIIIPIVDKLDEYLAMIGELSKRQDVSLFVGIREKFKETASFAPNVFVKVYSNESSKEEIINSLHAVKKETGKIMVARRPVSGAEVDSVLKSEADIIILKRPKSKISALWRRFWRFVIRSVFIFFFFEDISVVTFNETSFNLITSLTNLSFVTRVDRFVGMKTEYILTDTKPAKKEYDRFANFAQFFALTLAFIICILGSVILCSTILNLLTVMCGILICVIGFVLFALGVLTFARNLSVGKLRWGKAEEIR